MKELKLTGTTIVAMVDEADYNTVMQITWYLNQGRYVYHVNHGLVIFLHRFLMSAKPGFVVDHLDGNGLNNQRSNLRLCTQVENGQNRGKNKNNKSGYKGVCFISGRYLAKPWRANLRFNGTTKNLGNYASPEDAAQAYNKAVIENLDTHAYLNQV